MALFDDEDFTEDEIEMEEDNDIAYDIFVEECALRLHEIPSDKSVRPPRKRESSIKNRYHPLVAILFCTFFSFCDVVSEKKRIFAADMAKNVYIISGCNGAGKTTASYTVLPDILAKIQNYVKFLTARLLNAFPQDSCWGV